jgi:pimeloyl-ACP methyl ester carboxylesterase
VFCGHDWGGLVVWQMPLYHPDRVPGIIGVNTPFLPRPPIDPIMGMRALYGENMYIVYFQKPGEADAILAKDVGKTFRFFMRKNGMTAPRNTPSARRRSAISNSSTRCNPTKQMARRSGDDAEELQVFVDTFTRTGFTGGINWYRNFSRNWEIIRHRWNRRCACPA